MIDIVNLFSAAGTDRGYFNTTGKYNITLDQSEMSIYDISIK